MTLWDLRLNAMIESEKRWTAAARCLSRGRLRSLA